jgi:hypothetical protein
MIVMSGSRRLVARAPENPHRERMNSNMGPVPRLLQCYMGVVTVQSGRAWCHRLCLVAHQAHSQGPCSSAQSQQGSRLNEPLTMCPDHALFEGFSDDQTPARSSRSR